MSLHVLRGKCTAQGIQIVQGMSLEFVYHLSVAFLGYPNFTYVVLINRVLRGVVFGLS